MGFWDVLLDNLVLLHVLIPCLTLVVVAVACLRGIEIVRFVTFQGCLLWAACGVSILLQFDPSMPSSESPGFSQIVTSVTWQPIDEGHMVRLGVGADGLNLWYLVTLPWVALALVFWESGHKSWTCRDYCWLLSANAGLLLIAASRYLLLLGFGGAIAVLSLVWWTQSHRSSRQSPSPESTGLVIWGVTAGVLFAFGAAAAATSTLHVQEQNRVSEPLFSSDIDHIAFGLPQLADDSERAHLAWRQQAGGIFLAWLGATLACAGVWPMQEMLGRCLNRIESGPRLIVLCGLMPLGIYVFSRIEIPLLGEFIEAGMGWVVWPVLLSLAWHLAMLSRPIDCSEGILRLAMSAQLLAVVGCATGTASGICGAIMLSLSSGWAYAAWALLNSNDARWPRVRSNWLSLSLLAGCPGGGIFAGLWLIATGIMFGPQVGILSGVVLLATLGLLWVLIAGSAFRLASGSRRVFDGIVRRDIGSSWLYAGAYLMLTATLLSGVLCAQAMQRSIHAAEVVSGQAARSVSVSRE